YHLARPRGCAVINKRASQVVDVGGQGRVVGGEFLRLRQVEEAVDSRIEQSRQPLTGQLRRWSRGVLTAQEPPGQYPVRVGQRHGGAERGGVWVHGRYSLAPPPTGAKCRAPQNLPRPLRR